MPLSKPVMTTSALRPQTQTALMRQLGKSSGRKKNLLQQGFTLVELMIVIVIVGILSAIALPNFLSQSSKAKLTEAQQRASAGLKQAGIYFVENGTFAPSSTSITCADVGISPAASNNRHRHYHDNKCHRNGGRSKRRTGHRELGTHWSNRSDHKRHRGHNPINT
jgi:prepilin-type N-terminal cleavage/methylation domain-containing protein